MALKLSISVTLIFLLLGSIACHKNDKPDYDKKKRGTLGEREENGSGIQLRSPDVTITNVPVAATGFGADFSGQNIPNGAIQIGEARHTHITRKYAVPIPQPYGVPVANDNYVPFSQPVAVPVDRPFPVQVPQAVPVALDQPIPVPVDQPVAVPVPVNIPVPFQQNVAFPIPQPVPVAVRQTFPVPVPQPIPVGQSGFGVGPVFGTGFPGGQIAPQAGAFFNGAGFSGAPQASSIFGAGLTSQPGQFIGGPGLAPFAGPGGFLQGGGIVNQVNGLTGANFVGPSTSPGQITQAYFGGPVATINAQSSSGAIYPGLGSVGTVATVHLSKDHNKKW